jgi:3'-phosphoadenosine 5'-phosphosulfate (PAPS) 3'-phosphatase
MILLLIRLITQKIQQSYQAGKNRAITIVLNTIAAAPSSFKFASLASGAHQIYPRVE